MAASNAAWTRTVERTPIHRNLVEPAGFIAYRNTPLDRHEMITESTVNTAGVMCAMWRPARPAKKSRASLCHDIDPQIPGRQHDLESSRK